MTETDNTKIKVVLVDDHAVVRAGFRRLIDSTPGMNVIAELDCGDTVSQLCRSLQPDVVVMDLSMPGVGGIETIKRCKASECNKLAILVLSVHEDEPYPTKALKAGASGYLSKRCGPDELVQAILDVATGGQYISPAIAQKMARAQVGGHDGTIESLSEREFQVFSMLAKGMTVNDIAAVISLSPKTVHTHRANLMRKLNLGSTAELVLHAVRQGIVEKPSD